MNFGERKKLISKYTEQGKFCCDESFPLSMRLLWYQTVHLCPPHLPGVSEGWPRKLELEATLNSQIHSKEIKSILLRRDSINDWCALHSTAQLSYAGNCQVLRVYSTSDTRCGLLDRGLEVRFQPVPTILSHPITGGSASKEFALNVGDPWVRSLIPGSEDPLEKAMPTHTSILVWRILRTRSLAGYSPCGRKELDMTEQLILFTLSCSSKKRETRKRQVERII